MGIRNAFNTAAKTIDPNQKAKDTGAIFAGYVIPPTSQQNLENGKRIYYPSFDGYEKERQAEEPALYSAESLQETISDKNSMFINGSFYEIPEGFDPASVFGEQLYPDLDTCLKSNKAARFAMGDDGMVKYSHQEYREPFC